MKLLSVIQGRNRAERRRWLKAISKLPLEGWAFAGDLRLDLYQMCDDLIWLIERGLLGTDEVLIHVLGTVRLDAAALFTAVQRGLAKRLGVPVRVTYDASSPYLISGKHYQAFGLPVFTPTDFRLPAKPLPRTFGDVGSGALFPFGHTAVGRNLRIGDLCHVTDYAAATAWDHLSSLLVATHNVEALHWAIDAAHRIIDLAMRDAEQWAPAWLVEAFDAIGRAFAATDPASTRSVLRSHRAALQTISGTPAEDDEDYAR